MTKEKRKRGRPRKGEELNKGKPRKNKEVTRTIKRSIKALANHPTALKIAADMCNLTDNAPIQTETNTNTTIYKIVPTFPNSEKDVPEDPGIV